MQFVIGPDFRAQDEALFLLQLLASRGKITLLTVYKTEMAVILPICVPASDRRLQAITISMM